MPMLGLTMGGTLMAVIKPAGDKPWAWWECAVLAAMAIGIGIALVLAPMVVVTGYNGVFSAQRSPFVLTMLSCSAHGTW